MFIDVATTIRVLCRYARRITPSCSLCQPWYRLAVIDTAYRLAKPALFRLDPEAVHDRTIAALGRISRTTKATTVLSRAALSPDPRLAVNLAGISLPGPIGIAAGLDKNGVAFPALSALGWDIVEVGTITLKPQPGNPKPRVFRLPEDQALINRMGFPGLGADVIERNLLERKRSGVPVACNIGPNKSSVEAGLDGVIADCRLLAARFAAFASYLVLNISSPNTARLRDLQGKEALRVLLREVKAAIPAHAPVPLFVKIAPDMADAELDDVVEVVMETGLAGIVATNTTIARPGTLRDAHRIETGGLSGAPLRSRSLDVVRRIARVSEGKVEIVAVGGISSSEDVLNAIMAGATMVQIYTGLIYGGPALANKIKRDLLAHLDRVGTNSLNDLRRLP